MAEERDDSRFEAFLDTERYHIARRRGVQSWPDEQVSALALSGGGIRSATFCVGFLQALSARGVIPSIDYFSTVSGGSYAGSFFGSLFVPAEWRGDGQHGEPRPEFDPKRPLQSPLGEEAVRRLRDMGRYLTPSGTSDAFYGGAIVSRNWVAVQFVIGMSALLLFWIVHGLDTWIGPRVALPVLPMTATLELGAVTMLGLTFACGNAYWLTRRDVIPVNRVARVLSNTVVWAFFLLFVYTSTPWWADGWFGRWTPPAVGLVRFAAFVSGVAVALIIAAEVRFGRAVPALAAIADKPDAQRLIAAEDAVRSALSRWMARALTLTIVFALLALVDFTGHKVSNVLLDWFYWFQTGDFPRAIDTGKLTTAVVAQAPAATGTDVPDWWQRLELTWSILVALFPPIAGFVASRALKNRTPPTDPADVDTRSSWMPTIVVLTGALIVAVWLVIWGALADAVDALLGHIPGAWTTILIVLVMLNIGQSLCFSFINLSSLSTFYAARLRRAYIGASSFGTPNTSVRADDPQDTIRIHDYYEAGIANGAPLHLINVTVAETVADGSNLVARDRKGKPMHLSPAGIAFEGHRPGTIVARLRGTDGEQAVGEELPLANWVAISGAAVSAAIGAGTSLGTSILATMANVRLGYWWRSRLAHGWRAAFWAEANDTVQNYLFLELRGKFTGTARSRWYLTDGGHFDNTGVYPLLQRRVPFIIACDNGADPHYRMEDVMRLVGRARTDLGIDITFLDEMALADKLGPRSPIAGAVGTLGALRRRGSPVEPGGPIAALATIDYGPDAKGVSREGLLLLVKPKLAWLEPPEVLAYQSRQAEFPQQTTGDQFFDEEQWEAYRRLGEIAGERLFPERRPAGASGWLPYDPLGYDPGTAPRTGLRGRVERMLGR
jgi:hypothetical protein